MNTKSAFSSEGAVSHIEPLLIPDTAAAALAGVSRAHWHRLRAAGKVPVPVRLGRKVLWRRAELCSWIDAGCPDARTWAAMQAAGDRRLKVSY
jgi:predicted DNA-binding transcriptional regulator AlpA